MLEQYSNNQKIIFNKKDADTFQYMFFIMFWKTNIKGSDQTHCEEPKTCRSLVDRARSKFLLDTT